jgi:hypothetical protein
MLCDVGPRASASCCGSTAAAQPSFLSTLICPIQGTRRCGARPDDERPLHGKLRDSDRGPVVAGQRPSTLNASGLIGVGRSSTHTRRSRAEVPGPQRSGNRHCQLRHTRLAPAEKTKHPFAKIIYGLCRATIRTPPRLQTVPPLVNRSRSSLSSSNPHIKVGHGAALCPTSKTRNQLAVEKPLEFDMIWGCRRT